MRDDSSQTLQATVTKTIFVKGSFAIFATKEGFSAKGDIIDDTQQLVGKKLTLHGRMVESRYGKTFQFFSYDYEQSRGELFYFLTSVIEGISDKLAEKITQHYPGGAGFDAVVQNDPNKLLQIEGLGKKRLEKIVQGWRQKQQLRSLWEFLSEYGVTNKMVLDIYENLGEQSINVIKQNPYAIADIKGVGFKKADALAMQLGFDPGSKKRLQSCILYTLQRHMIGRGHSVMEAAKLFELTRQESRVDESFILDQDEFETITAAMEDFNLLYAPVKGHYTLPSFAHMEESVIETMRANARTTGKAISGDLERFIKTFEQKEGVVFDARQKEAIALGNKQAGIFSITGYAGTGKTTTSKAILQLYESCFGYDKIVGCALSGVAANRIKQQSGFEAKTIHSLLGMDEGGGFVYNAKNPLKQKVILVDESSMIDISIFYALFEAVDFDHSIVILLGDPAQLPPVGPGEVFSDAIDCGLVANVTLDTIYRQSEDAVIKLFAGEVRHGMIPQGYDEKYSDFFFIPRCEGALAGGDCMAQTVSYIKKIALRLKPEIEAAAKEDMWLSLRTFVVITPMKETPLGTKNLNIALQSVLNEEATTQIKVFDKVYKTGDKVIHLKNQNMNTYDTYEYNNADGRCDQRRVFNGQIGVIDYIDKQEDEIYVYFPNEKYYALYCAGDFKNGAIDLGYAISGHKSQGSEYENVVIPLTKAHYVMLNNKLMYTMMTRAKQRLVLVGQREAFEIACRRSDETKRDTLMKLL